LAEKSERNEKKDMKKIKRGKIIFTKETIKIVILLTLIKQFSKAKLVMKYLINSNLREY